MKFETDGNPLRELEELQARFPQLYSSEIMGLSYGLIRGRQVLNSLLSELLGGERMIPSALLAGNDYVERMLNHQKVVEELVEARKGDNSVLWTQKEASDMFLRGAIFHCDYIASQQ